MVRLKVRYLLFEVLYPNKQHQIEGSQLLNSLKSSIENNFGEMGVGECQPTLALRHFHKQTQSGIIRISRAQTPVVQGALTFIKSIDNCDVVIRVTHVSGTIKKCRRKGVNIRRNELLQVRNK